MQSLECGGQRSGDGALDLLSMTTLANPKRSRAALTSALQGATRLKSARRAQRRRRFGFLKCDNARQSKAESRCACRSTPGSDEIGVGRQSGDGAFAFLSMTTLANRKRSRAALSSALQGATRLKCARRAQRRRRLGSLNYDNARQSKAELASALQGATRIAAQGWSKCKPNRF